MITKNVLAIELCSLLALFAVGCGAVPDGSDAPSSGAAAEESSAAVAVNSADVLAPPQAAPGVGHDLSKAQLAPPGSQWNLPAHGGTGGSGGPNLTGVVIYAMQVNSGKYVDQLSLAYYIPSGSDNLYRAGDYYSTLGPVGGGGGHSNAWTYCPTNYGAVGIQGRSGSYLDAVGLICSNATNPSPTTEVTLPMYGGSGGGYFYDDCGNGMLMVGVNLRDGSYIDNIQGVCNKAH